MEAVPGYPQAIDAELGEMQGLILDCVLVSGPGHVLNPRRPQHLAADGRRAAHPSLAARHGRRCTGSVEQSRVTGRVQSGCTDNSAEGATDG